MRDLSKALEDRTFADADPRLLKRFLEYHSKNPAVYDTFVAYAHRIRAVHRTYSAWVIIQVIRWEHDLKTADVFKINNDFIALYARALMVEQPTSFEGFFELRQMKPTRLLSKEDATRQGRDQDDYG